MTLRHVEIFAAVCQEGSVTRAAERLRISQPTVSIAIREMENHYQAKLFDRISNRFYITPFGQTIYDYALRLLNLNTDMLAVRQSVSLVRVGSGMAIANLQMADIAKSFLEKYPDIQLHLRSRSPSKLYQQIMINDLDFVLAEPVSEIPGLKRRAILKYPMVAVCHRDNPLANKRNVQAEDIARENLFCREPSSPSRWIVEAYFHNHNLSPVPLWESSGLISLMNAVQENMGICFVSLDQLLAYDSADLVVLDIPDFQAERYVNLCYHKDKIFTQPMKKFIAHYISESTNLLKQSLQKYRRIHPDTLWTETVLDEAIIAEDLLDTGE